MIAYVTKAVHTLGEGQNAGRERVAVAYDPKNDCLEVVILSQGNGCGDDRILADEDESESIDPDVLRQAAKEIFESSNASEDANPATWESWWDIHNYLWMQADYIEQRQA
jgi:hypothetical protein